MNPPIVIVESYDISVHPSVEHAEAYLEPVDVLNGIYLAYDCDGYLLDLQVSLHIKERHFWFIKWVAQYEGITIKEHVPKTDRSVELREKLIYYLMHRGTPENELQGLPLAALIRRMGKYMPWRI
jgi:hypothetical protein